MRERQPRHQRPLRVVGPDHRGAHVAAERQRPLAAGEVRLRPAAPEREDAAVARLAVHRERRAGQQIPAPEAHLEESAAVEPAGRPGRAQRTRRGAEPRHGTHRPARRGHRRVGREPRRPVRPHAASRQAAQRSAGAASERMRAGRTTKPVEEAQRHLARHPRPQRPAREPALDARRPRRRDPFLHMLDHVHRRRPAEPRQQRARQRVPVLDRPGRLAVRQPPARGVRQR